MPCEAGVLRLDRPFALEHGGRIAECEIAWAAAGPADAPLVIALGGISASRYVTASCVGMRSSVQQVPSIERGSPSPQPTTRNAEPRTGHRQPGTGNREPGTGNRAPATSNREPGTGNGIAAGWWHVLAGEGRALDTRTHRVLGIDWLGGAGDSSGPATLQPFPVVDTKDQARAVAAVLDHLGVARAKAVIGASYGGMVALAFAALFPQRFDRAVIFSAAHRSHPMATALRSLQRRVVRLGIETGRAEDALRIARALAMTTYRTAHEFAERFPTAPRRLEPVVQFPVEDYLDHCGTRFAETFSPEAFLRLSESIDLHDIEPERIAADITIAVVKDDPLVPVWQARELAARLGTQASTPGQTAKRRRAHVIEIDSIYGHDAFLKEVAVVSNILTEALDTEAAR
ncbi:MAG: alpha/beta fold hydrolase [Longimicrobiales bacterium]